MAIELNSNGTTTASGGSIPINMGSPPSPPNVFPNVLMHHPLEVADANGNLIIHNGEPVTPPQEMYPGGSPPGTGPIGTPSNPFPSLSEPLPGTGATSIENTVNQPAGLPLSPDNDADQGGSRMEAPNPDEVYLPTRKHIEHIVRHIKEQQESRSARKNRPEGSGVQGVR